MLGLLLLVLLLAYCSVVQGSVERGRQLNRQMAELATACQPRARQTLAPRCRKEAAVDPSVLEAQLNPGARP